LQLLASLLVLRFRVEQSGRDESRTYTIDLPFVPFAFFATSLWPGFAAT